MKTADGHVVTDNDKFWKLGTFYYNPVFVIVVVIVIEVLAN
ncbi:MULTISPECIES: hypothetical protein [Brevibacillus]|nr:hypothetical protein [Brevibacillus brevis]WGV57079.1 hypothetical protein QIH01_16375 [Brevibacillus brevis]